MCAAKRAPFIKRNGRIDTDSPTETKVDSHQNEPAPIETNSKAYIDSTRIPYKKLEIIAELLK